MGTLKLRPIEDDRPVKLTLEIPAATYRDLVAYAQAHAAQHGHTDAKGPERLIAPMLERFMASDRGFARRAR